MSKKKYQRKGEAGFTLVELSIVLVIIGLIVGGVLAGQSLINSAKLQAEITRYNQLNTAFNAFYLQNGELPGDTQNIGAFTGSIATIAAGNNDGYVATSAANGVPPTPANFKTSEMANAGAELMLAGLVAGTPVDPTGSTSSNIAFGTTAGDIMQARLAGGIVIYGDATSGHNWARYGVVGDAGAGGAATLANNYSSAQVLAIDSKIDDGVAITGIVQSAGLATPAFTDVGAVACNALATGIYAGTSQATSCGMKIQFSQ